MKRHMSLTLLCLALAFGHTACAPKRLGPTPSGYTFSLQVSDSLIWLESSPPASTRRYPTSAELIVQVWNARGEPVDGVPVEFQVDSAWTQNASVSPQRVMTHDGVARAVFRATTIGVVPVLVRVDQVPQETAITVSSPADTGRQT
jgi:hypothetical protein